MRRQKRYRSHATPTSIRVAFDIPVELHDCLHVVCAVTGFLPVMQAALRTAIARLNAESDALDGRGYREDFGSKRSVGFIADIERAIARHQAEQALRDQARESKRRPLRLLKGKSQ